MMRIGTIEYPSEINIDGPWILNAESLEELDEIITSSWTLLIDDFELYKENAIQFRLENEKKEDNEADRKRILGDLKKYGSYKFTREEKSFIGLLHGDKKIISTSLKELIYDPQIDDHKITGLAIRLTKWENSLDIEIDNRYSGAFKVKFEGSNGELKRSILTSFNKWTKKYSPKPHVRIWSKFSPEHWAIFVLLLVLQLLILPTISGNYRDELKRRAFAEINKGDSLNQKRAMKILLELETELIPINYKPTETTSSQSNLRKFFWYGLIVCILLSYRPKTLVGIGGNVSKYKFMVWWIKIITVTIPSIILIPIIRSKLLGII